MMQILKLLLKENAVFNLLHLPYVFISTVSLIVVRSVHVISRHEWEEGTFVNILIFCFRFI